MTTLPAPAPRTPAGGAGLAALITAPKTALVALDYDGTLSPIVLRPSDAVPVPGALDALRVLAGRVGTCAIITGRPVDVVLELTGLVSGGARAQGGGSGKNAAAGNGAAPEALTNLTVLGQYGLQRWDGTTGVTTSPEPLPGVARVRALLPEVLRDAPPGVTVEDKVQALVVHVRRAADPDAALGALAPALRRLAEDHGLEAAPGKKVLELRPPHHDKGRALRELVAERAARSVLVAGDDLGDLPAFDAVDRLRSAGIAGLTVCSDGPEVPAVLRDRADLVVDGPAGVVALLRVLTNRLR
ncbi:MULTISPECIES: trehalose-phosphatase [unclassified Pseudofrankia]|uniref:trehalose-phosphatase n=1 Tax=unclassified Pseudofrankia TaxID=2994372 RepID=UPI0008D9E4A2|nr:MULTISPECIES: trehalose-phosphatase [unclassified Pseudofrankia]MDT3443531.1 trehalose-phosphatase [Pseudofrankia sp. BMG5.37]OHV42732.1 trehalose-phosphatase [Pseudofrankia sp. BMG5.36]